MSEDALLAESCCVVAGMRSGGFGDRLDCGGFDNFSASLKFLRQYRRVVCQFSRFQGSREAMALEPVVAGNGRLGRANHLVCGQSGEEVALDKWG